MDRSSIAAVALTTQRSTVINLDKDGKPLRPAIVWLDQRRTEGLKPVSGLWGAAFAAAGMTETVAYLQAEAEANWIRTHQPEIWKDTHKYLLLSGYLTYLLTGSYVDSVGCQVGYIPFDYKTKHWANRFDWKWQAVPMDKHILPDLVPPGARLGEITPAAAEATGIPAGLPLIAAAADKACEVIGSGALEPHIACLSYGTTATINTTHRQYIEVIPLIPPYPAAVPGRLQPGDPDLPRLLDGQLVQAGVRADRAAPGRRSGRRARRPVRRTGARRAARLSRAGAAALLVARAARPRPRGARRHHRLQRRAHPRPSLPRHPGRAGLCPARRRRAHRQTQRRADHRTARGRRRQPEPAPPCSSPRMFSACPPPARTSTRPPAWAPPSTPPWALACTRISRPPSTR